MQPIDQSREKYPMCFYPGSLGKIKQTLEGKEVLPNFQLEPLPLSPQDFHYVNYLKLLQLKLLAISSISLTALILGLILSIQTLSVGLTLLSIIVLIYYCIVLIIYKSNQQKLRSILRKVKSRKYFLFDSVKINYISRKTDLLINSLPAREGIYSFVYNRAKEGITESYFLSYLDIWLGHLPSWRVLQHCQFQDEYCYTADFTLINDDLKLGVNLEIDEPYTLKDRTPIHLFEDRKYAFRDNFFLSLGFIVIRFAEYQIVKYPDNCCLYIVKILNQFLDPNYEIPIPSTAQIFSITNCQWQVKSWNRRESEVSAMNNVRELYLKPSGLIE